jgi:hypothetical protein
MAAYGRGHTISGVARYAWPSLDVIQVELDIHAPGSINHGKRPFIALNFVKVKDRWL